MCSRSEELLNLLLSRGATVDQKDVDGWTPLHYASLNGWEAGVALLLANGANYDAQTKSQSFPLLFTVKNSHTAATKALLISGADHQKTDESKRSLLMWAAGTGNLEILQVYNYIYTMM